MKREEIEAKIAALQEQLKELDEQVEYGELKAGDRFKWCGLIFVKLKNGFALLDDLEDVKGKFCIFDPYNNDYATSVVRDYLNAKFLKINNIDSGKLGWVTLLSKEEYEENEDIITQLDDWWWLRSPNPGDSLRTYCVGSLGNIDYGRVINTVAVRAAFNLKPDTLVSIIK